MAVDRLLGMLSLALMGDGRRCWRGRPTASQRLAASLARSSRPASRCVAALLGRSPCCAVVPAASARSGRRSRRLLRVADAVGRYRGRRGTLAARDGLVGRRPGAADHRRPTCSGLGLGLTVPFSYYLLFMPLGLLMLLLPISVSGFGLPQGVIVWLLRPLGVPDAQSFALSTLIVLTGLAGNLPGLVAVVAAAPSSPVNPAGPTLTADPKSCRI